VSAEPRRLDGEAIAARLKARAQLLRSEAERSGRVGADRIFQEVTAHQVDGAFMKGAGIGPESWTGRQIAAALERGEAANHRMHVLKGATAVAMTVFTGGLGGTAVLATITAASMGSLSLAEARAKVHQAEAGETAGTMGPGAIDVAKANERAAQVGFVVSTAHPALVSVAGHHAIESVARVVVQHAALSEQAAKLGTHALAEGSVRRRFKRARSWCTRRTTEKAH